MTEGQFAVISCALLTIAIMVGPAWHAVFVFLVALASFVGFEYLSEWISRRRELRGIRRARR